eukprot:GEMP01036228.1.p1 GENE.GEMP01036228.1~~GEMP01036228.1.p1  ORF type:complete len:155 (+),score=27.13 GEMP01036228.1:340-804(+)
MGMSTGEMTGYAILLGGVSTLAVGVMWIINYFGKLTFNMCDDIASTPCNPSFSVIFTINPIQLAEIWQPTIFGLWVVSMSTPWTQVEALVPRTWIQAFFMMTMVALWGNFGYLGNFAFFSGIANLVFAGACLVNHFMKQEDFYPVVLFASKFEE